MNARALALHMCGWKSTTAPGCFYVCTRPLWHDGNHMAAGVGGRVLAEWGDVVGEAS